MSPANSLVARMAKLYSDAEHFVGQCDDAAQLALIAQDYRFYGDQVSVLAREAEEKSLEAPLD